MKYKGKEVTVLCYKKAVKKTIAKEIDPAKGWSYLFHTITDECSKLYCPYKGSLDDQRLMFRMFDACPPTKEHLRKCEGWRLDSVSTNFRPSVDELQDGTED